MTLQWETHNLVFVYRSRLDRSVDPGLIAGFIVSVLVENCDLVTWHSVRQRFSKTFTPRLLRTPFLQCNSQGKAENTRWFYVSDMLQAKTAALIHIPPTIATDLGSPIATIRQGLRYLESPLFEKSLVNVSQAWSIYAHNGGVDDVMLGTSRYTTPPWRAMM